MQDGPIDEAIASVNHVLTHLNENLRYSDKGQCKMDNVEFRRRTIAAYARARKEGFDNFAEALLEVLNANLNECGVQKPDEIDFTIPPQSIQIFAVH